MPIWSRNGRELFWRALSAGQQQEQPLGMYVVNYPVGAFYWQDATTIMLADTGGLDGRSHNYCLKLHGME